MPRRALISLLCFFLWPKTVYSLYGTLSAIPRTIPVVNRTPYFGIWATAGDPNVAPTVAGTNLTTRSGDTLDWTGYVRVDGQVYQWLGSSSTDVKHATTTGTYLTATMTMFEMEAGVMALNVIFLSPVEPTNISLQSFPFAYVYVEARSNDGQAHSVQFYTDVSPSLLTATNETVVWNTTLTPTSVCHSMRRPTPSPVEVGDQVENASIYYAMPAGEGVTYQTGAFSLVRQGFISNGKLNNSEDVAFRAARAPNYPVNALAIDLGSVALTNNAVVWAIGHVRENLFTSFSSSPAGNETRASFFSSTYPSIPDAIDAFLADSFFARSRAEYVDGKLRNTRTAFSVEYADLVSLSLRQTMGAIEFAIPRPVGNEAWNDTDVHAYMRDTGTSSRANPVEVIYAAMPTFLYLNPKILWYLLKPLLVFQASPKYGNMYAAPDLGNNYLTPVGNATTDEELGVEHSGNMLIMAAAYGIQTNDWGSLVPYGSMLLTWSNYLVAQIVSPKLMISADGLVATNQSNLILKGIVGIYAGSRIAAGLGLDSDRTYLESQATSFARVWETMAIAPDKHIVSTFGNEETWSMAYNAFPAILLAPDLFDKKIFRGQSKFYDRMADSGLGWDSVQPNSVKSHWTMFTAASVTSASTRDKLISYIWNRAFDTIRSFGTTYYADNALPPLGRSSPAQGATFSLLAMQVFNVEFLPHRTDRSAKVRAIAGGVVGGIATFALLALAFLWLKWNKNRSLDLRDSDTFLRYLTRFGRRKAPWGPAPPYSDAVPQAVDLMPLPLNGTAGHEEQRGEQQLPSYQAIGVPPPRYT